MMPEACSSFIFPSLASKNLEEGNNGDSGRQQKRKGKAARQGHEKKTGREPPPGTESLQLSPSLDATSQCRPLSTRHPPQFHTCGRWEGRGGECQWAKMDRPPSFRSSWNWSFFFFLSVRPSVRLSLRRSYNRSAPPAIASVRPSFLLSTSYFLHIV